MDSATHRARHAASSTPLYSCKADCYSHTYPNRVNALAVLEVGGELHITEATTNAPSSARSSHEFPDLIQGYHLQAPDWFSLRVLAWITMRDDCSRWFMLYP